MSNNETWAERLNYYAQRRNWPISWDFAAGIGNDAYNSHLWTVTCTVNGVPYVGQSESSRSKAKDSASEAAWRDLALQDDG